MVLLPLSQGYFSKIDDEDYEKVKDFSWLIFRNGRGVYARTVWMEGRSQRHCLLHRKILDVPKNLVVDHIDGDGLNNQKSNLRAVTIAINSQNRVKPADNNKTGTNGVWFNKKVGRWMVERTFNSKKLHIGSFREKQDALLALERFNRTGEKSLKKIYTPRLPLVLTPRLGFEKKTKKWRVRLVNKHLGRFKTKEEAESFILTSKKPLC